MSDKLSINPLVSIIMPLFNGEHFIREAIDSVIDQTYHNWELFLVNDGSKDASIQIALQYTERYPETIHYLEHNNCDNRGISATRNLGLSKSKGEYIAFIDQDDVWLPHYLEQQIATLESTPKAAMVYGPFLIWHSWTSKREDIQRDSVQELGIKSSTLYKPKSLFAHFLHNIGSTPLPGATLVRRNVIERVGGWVEHFRDMYEDQVLFTKICLQEYIFVSDEHMVKYRRHKDSVCCVAGKTEQYHSSRLHFLTWLETYLNENGFKQLSIQMALKKELLPYRHPALYYLMRQKKLQPLVSSVIRHATPKPIKRILKRYLHFFGILKARIRLTIKTQALSTKWGFDRGQPIHRYYLGQFLMESSSDIHGHCLEFQEDSYTKKFGGAAVTKVDILHLDHSLPQVTIAADLTKPNDIPTNQFDCIICTHVLHIVFELEKMVSELFRILKPGGVLLVAVPHISMCGEKAHEVWRFTPEGLQMVLARAFGKDNISIKAYGNSLTAAGDLRGLVTHEFTQKELNYHDPRFAIEVCARAVKAV
jgi:glycosyltransferase involved in cell wall biosynthesis